MTYILKVSLNKETKIEVGKLGKLRFEKGVYFYVGSAKKNLKTRIARHCSKNKKLFWHIDYLLSCGLAEMKKILVYKGNNECQIAQLLYKRGFNFIGKFGSSDCRCPTHLFFTSSGNDIRLPQLLIRKGFRYADKNYF